eukprot:Amastigsp_a174979_86.p2 type:complete len:284 gc:universal Amastigsp_a174979_86:1-852(+)
MAVAGLDRCAPAEHAYALARMALDMIAAAAATRVDESNPRSPFLQIRVGIDTGPVAASITGTTDCKLTFIGDTVNTASRMEHSGEPGRVVVSERTNSAIGRSIASKERPAKNIKGKGVMRSFVLVAPKHEDDKDAFTAWGDDSVLSGSTGIVSPGSPKPDARKGSTPGRQRSAQPGELNRVAAVSTSSAPQRRGSNTTLPTGSNNNSSGSLVLPKAVSAAVSPRPAESPKASSGGNSRASPVPASPSGALSPPTLISSAASNPTAAPTSTATKFGSLLGNLND